MKEYLINGSQPSDNQFSDIKQIQAVDPRIWEAGTRQSLAFLLENLLDSYQNDVNNFLSINQLASSNPFNNQSYLLLFPPDRMQTTRWSVPGATALSRRSTPMWTWWSWSMALMEKGERLWLGAEVTFWRWVRHMYGHPRSAQTRTFFPILFPTKIIVWISKDTPKGKNRDHHFASWPANRETSCWVSCVAFRGRWCSWSRLWSIAP